MGQKSDQGIGVGEEQQKAEEDLTNKLALLLPFITAGYILHGFIPLVPEVFVLWTHWVGFVEELSAPDGNERGAEIKETREETLMAE